jgi:hypothetical protein
MNHKRANERLDSFNIDMSLFDPPPDKIIGKMPRKSMPNPKETMAGITGPSGLGATYEGSNDDDKYLDDLILNLDPDEVPPSMEEIVSKLPNYQPSQGKGGASRKMRRSRKTRRSRRMRKVKSQMRRKNSSRKSARRRQRK